MIRTKLMFPIVMAAPMIFAQAKPATPMKVDPPPAQPTPKSTPMPAAPQPLTELEQTKLQLEMTQAALLQTQVTELQQKHAATVAKINADHPGYVYSDQTGQLVSIQGKPEAKK